MTIELELLERVTAGNQSAWHALLAQISPLIARRVRFSPKMRKRFRDLDRSDCDYVHDVCARVYERLARNEFRNIRLYLQDAKSRPTSSFTMWLRIGTDFAIDSYVEEKYGYARSKRGVDAADADRARHHKRDVGSFATALPDDDLHRGQVSTFSGALDCLRMTQYARDTFSAQELVCFNEYLEGASYREIAATAKCGGAAHAEDIIRKLKERLRAGMQDGRIMRAGRIESDTNATHAST